MDKKSKIMQNFHVAIIGGGPSGIYVLKNLVGSGSSGLQITIINPDKIGYSSPWSQPWACLDHMANIGSEEIPDLVQPVHEWLSHKEDGWLLERKIKRSDIHPRGLYPRIVMGEYFNEQYVLLCALAKNKGISVVGMEEHRVTDVEDRPRENRVSVSLVNSKDESSVMEVNKVVISTGHSWTKDKEVENRGCFETPWPITKLKDRKNHPIGLLGSSLSAIDVTIGMAMEHGRFETGPSGLTYIPNPGTKHFKIVMHSRSGVLPNLRHYFEFPRLEIYRYIQPSEIDKHCRGNKGYLSLDFMFDVFKQTMRKRDPSFYNKIKKFNLEGFVEYMMSDRRKRHPFELLQSELEESYESLASKRPIHWKEVLDDVVYTITFEGKKMSAEDMIRFNDNLMPFFSYISAFMPPQSAERLLALYKACKLEVVSIGDISLVEISESHEGAVLTYVDKSNRIQRVSYKTFIKCLGQKVLPFGHFPFKTLVKQQVVSPAELPFCDNQSAVNLIEANSSHCLRTVKHGRNYFYEIGGIAVNDQFQAISTRGEKSERISVIGIAHIMGLFPYHPGLAFSAHSAEVVVDNILGIKPVNSEKQILQSVLRYLEFGRVFN